MSDDDCRIACHLDFPKYVITGLGDVVSLVKQNGKVLKPISCGKYPGFSLVNRNGKLTRVYAHRLVAETFHGAPKEGQEVRHLDGRIGNRRQSNLAWGTRSENMRDKERHGTDLRGEWHPTSVLTDAAVMGMRDDRRLGLSFGALAAKYGVSTMTAFRAATGRSWAHLRGAAE